MSLSEAEIPPDGPGPALVQWYPPGRRPLLTTEGKALVMTAVGAAALGALAVGALSIGALAIGRMAVGKARIRELRIDRLVVDQLVSPKD